MYSFWFINQQTHITGRPGRTRPSHRQDASPPMVKVCSRSWRPVSVRNSDQWNMSWISETFWWIHLEVSKKAGDTGIAPNLPFNHGIFHYNHENHPFGGTPICGNPHLGPFGGNDSPMTSIDGLGPGSLGLNNSIQQSVSTCDVYIYIRICIYI